MPNFSLQASEFEALVIKHFKFLVDNHKFTVKKIDDWTYYIENRVMRVRILLEHSTLLSIAIEPIGEGANQLLRKNISPYGGLSLVIISMCLDSQLKYKIDRHEGSIATNVPVELEKQTNLLNRYCQKMLKGDFSEWEQIEECRAERRNEFIRI